MNDLLSFILSQSPHFRRARLSSLYSDFTLQRYSNPDGFAANVAAWADALGNAAKAGLLPTDVEGNSVFSLMTGENLLLSLETKEWGRPLALGAVIVGIETYFPLRVPPKHSSNVAAKDEAISQRLMVPYAEFLAARSSIYDRTWSFQPWWLISWAFKNVRLSDTQSGSKKLPVGRFVILPNVEEVATNIVEQMGTHSNPLDRIYPMAMFISETARIAGTQARLTESDHRIILTFLAREKSAIIYDEKVVKFKDASDTSSTLSTHDITIASLKSLIATITAQIAILAARTSALSEKAQDAVRNKNKITALWALRSKKLNETTLTQRSGILSQLQEVYTKIEEAADHVAVYRAVTASAVVLRSMHAEIGEIDEAESVVEGLRDEMNKVEELGNVLQGDIHPHEAVDEDAVDEEFEAMETQARHDDEHRETRQTQEKLDSIDDSKEIRREHEPRTSQLQNSLSPAPRRPSAINKTPDVAEVWERHSLDGKLVFRDTVAPQVPLEKIPNTAPGG